MDAESTDGTTYVPLSDLCTPGRVAGWRRVLYLWQHFISFCAGRSPLLGQAEEREAHNTLFGPETVNFKCRANWPFQFVAGDSSLQLLSQTTLYGSFEPVDINQFDALQLHINEGQSLPFALCQSEHLITTFYYMVRFVTYLSEDSRKQYTGLRAMFVPKPVPSEFVCLVMGESYSAFDLASLHTEDAHDLEQNCEKLVQLNGCQRTITQDMYRNMKAQVVRDQAQGQSSSAPSHQAVGVGGHEGILPGSTGE